MSYSPLKIKEYLACGRPVVATAVPEALRLALLVHVRKHASGLELVEVTEQLGTLRNAEKQPRPIQLLVESSSLPLRFAQVKIVFVSVVFAPRQIDESGFEEIRANLGKAMIDGTQKVLS